MLIVLHLIAAKVLPLPLLYLSAYFERHREEYYDELLAVSRSGEWDPWLEFFLRGVVEQGQDALVRSRALRNLHDRNRTRMQEVGASANALQVVDHLFRDPHPHQPIGRRSARHHAAGREQNPAAAGRPGRGRTGRGVAPPLVRRARCPARRRGAPVRAIGPRLAGPAALSATTTN